MEDSSIVGTTKGRKSENFPNVYYSQKPCIKKLMNNLISHCSFLCDRPNEYFAIPLFLSDQQAAGIIDRGATRCQNDAPGYARSTEPQHSSTQKLCWLPTIDKSCTFVKSILHKNSHRLEPSLVHEAELKHQELKRSV